jgi:flagellin-like hook-associated protein FlgL
VGLKISTNLLSLSVQRSLATTTRALQRSMQRLSSGSRINTGRDDPAGLAMASGLESQRRGLLQGVRNINDSRGFLETADGAMAEQTNMIQRMRELAVQASNGTLSSDTRNYLNTEMQQLLAEFNRLTTQTQFNGVNLLDGSFGTKNIQVGSQKGHTISLTLSNMQPSVVFTTTTTTTSVTTSGGSTGSGTFQARSTITNLAPAEVHLADLNGDGKLDLLVGSWASGDSYFIGNGNGTFQGEDIVEPGNDGYDFSMIAADFTGDGKLDLVGVAAGNNTVNIWKGNGDGTFVTPHSAPTLLNSGGLKINAVDVNGDGKLDLIIGDLSDSTVAITLGNGNGTFNTRSTVRVGSNPERVTVADVNGDGKIDIVSADANSNTLSILLGNGNGTFLARTTTATGTYPQDVQAADFNGDGKLDLVVSDSNGNTISLFLGNGNGTFKVRTTVATGTYPDSMVVADFNGDGKLDIAEPDEHTGTISILLGNGNGTFLTRSTLRNGTNPDSANVAAGDLNGDGILDLVAGNFTDNTISIFIGNSNGGSGSTTTTTTSSTSTLLASIYLTTQSAAQDALAVFDSALAYINSARANIGALQSRLDFASSVNMNTVENISEARSQIMDVDMAAETAEFARLQIMQRAGVAVLGQANMAAQLTLKLLEGL